MPGPQVCGAAPFTVRIAEGWPPYKRGAFLAGRARAKSLPLQGR